MSIFGLKRLFEARSIAVVGGSPRPQSVGRAVLANLRKGPFAGDLFFVNTRHPQLEGLSAHSTLSALPHPPDVIVITTPPAQVPQVINEAGGAGAAVIITAGLGHGPGSIAEAAEHAGRQAGVRLIGPNCLGVLTPNNGMNASFAAQAVRAGDVALLSQSGAIAAAMIDRGVQRNIGFSAIVSIGDQLDVDFGDLLDYFALDRHTRAILLYVEAIKDARKFMSAARAAARAKPVVVVKAGRTTASAKAAATHTGALAGSDAVYDAAFRRAGLLRVPDLAELLDAAATLARVKSVTGNRLAILTNGGGLGVLAVDLLSEQGDALAELSPSTKIILNSLLPPTWSKADPVDIIGDADADRYAGAIDTLLSDPASDALLVLNVQTALARPLEIAQAVAARVQSHRKRETFPKPVFAAWVGNELQTQAIFDEAGIPSYVSESDAVRGFTYLAQYREALETLARTPPAASSVDRSNRESVAQIVANAVAQHREWLNPVEVSQVLAAYAIPAVATLQAGTPDQAAEIAMQFIDKGSPVAVKISSRDITHKSDVDGVRLGLVDGTAVRMAAETVLANAAKAMPLAKLQGVTVQPMIVRKTAHELIIGVARDPTFGAIMLFGQGGTAVEVINDKVLALPPLDFNLAMDMIARTRIFRLLRGYRNVPAARIDDVAAVLTQISQLAADFPEIHELDINPLLADENGVLALDMRIKVGDPLAIFKGQRQGHFAIRPYPVEWERTLKLGDFDLLLRPVRADDEPLFVSFLSAISPQDLRLRFFGALKNPDHAFIARLTQLDYARSIAFAAIDQATNSLLGVVRLHAEPNYETAEYAVLVRSDLKGHGLGWELMKKIINYAQSEGLKAITGQVLKENGTMIEMCKKLGFSVNSDPDDRSLYEVRLDLATAPIR